MISEPLRVLPGKQARAIGRQAGHGVRGNDRAPRPRWQQLMEKKPQNDQDRGEERPAEITPASLRGGLVSHGQTLGVSILYRF
jgi:hypothetical protein